jgi:hypothetical protein
MKAKKPKAPRITLQDVIESVNQNADVGNHNQQIMQDVVGDLIEHVADLEDRISNLGEAFSAHVNRAPEPTLWQRLMAKVWP